MFSKELRVRRLLPMEFRRFRGGDAKRMNSMAFLLLACLVSVLMTSGWASAEQVQIQFLGPEDGAYVYDVVQKYYVYIDPYKATITGGNGEHWGNPTQVWCIDDKHQVYPGETWNAYVTPLTSSDLSHTYLGNSNTYKEMAYLIDEYKGLPLSDMKDRRAIQWVIWDLSLGGTAHGSQSPDYTMWKHDSDWSVLYNQWRDDAIAHYNSPQQNYAGWDILSGFAPYPSPGGQPQEFMVYVPEPVGILIFLGCTMMGIAGLARRLRK